MSRKITMSARPMLSQRYWTLSIPGIPSPIRAHLEVGNWPRHSAKYNVRPNDSASFAAMWIYRPLSTTRAVFLERSSTYAYPFCVGGGGTPGGKGGLLGELAGVGVCPKGVPGAG